MGGWFRKEIKTVADLKGLKTRIPGIGGEVDGALWGVVPQALPVSEIAPALERGLIDAAEFVGPYDDEKLGLYKVAKHYYYPAFWEGGAEVCLMINAAQWDKLPKLYQEAVESAAAEANVKMQALYDAKNPIALKSLIAGRRQAACVPARRAARREQGQPSSLYDGGGGEEPRVQEALRALEEVPRAAVRMV